MVLLTDSGATHGRAAASRRGATHLRRLAWLALVLVAIAMAAAPARAAGDHVVRLRLTGIIDPVNAAYVEEGLHAAASSEAAAVLIELDSPGGALTAMDRIIEAILGSEVPVIAYVAPDGARAGSAATFITLAADVAAMAPATNIGAASVIDSSGNDLDSTLERKVTNDAVARIRELADRHDRNADWAESAVRDAASIGSSEAVAMDPPVVDILATDTEDLLAQIDEGARADGRAFEFDGRPLPELASLEIRDAEMNFGQQVLHLLADPNIAFILFTVGFYGILAELFHPNFFSGAVGALALLLAFISFDTLPLNVGGLLLIALGVGLLFLELHVTSFGLLTVGGLVAFVLGAFALYTRVEPGQPVGLTVQPWLIGTVAALTLVYVAVVLRALLAARRQRSGALPIGQLLGAGGVAQTVMSPTGIAYSQGETWSARSRGGLITPGTPITVVGVEGLELIVEPAASAERTTAREAEHATGG